MYCISVNSGITESRFSQNLELLNPEIRQIQGFPFQKVLVSVHLNPKFLLLYTMKQKKVHNEKQLCNKYTIIFLLIKS